MATYPCKYQDSSKYPCPKELQDICPKRGFKDSCFCRVKQEYYFEKEKTVK